MLLQVAELLADHLDLLLEFFACLPDDIPLWVRVRVIGEDWIGHGKELYIESSKTGLFSFLFLLGLVAGVLSVNSSD